MKKLLLVSTGDPTDKRTWSGTEYSIWQQLMKYYEVDVLSINLKWIKRFERLRMRILTFGKQDTVFGFLNSYLSSKKVERKLSSGIYDAAFVFGCTNIAYIKTDTPIAYFTDATTHLMQNYYWHYCRILEREADIIQSRCLKNSSVNLAASTWALDDMVNYFGISGEKCVLCRLGANVNVENLQSKKEESVINILFVGADWERKGGSTAIETVKRLKTMDASRRYVLHIVGGMPRNGISTEDIIFYGFLDRKNAEQDALRTKLFQKSDIFLLPTKAECAGIVFCEASAYGIPIVTYDTGGIGDYVVNGFNGFRLPARSSSKEFAETILDIVNNPSLKEHLMENGKKIYAESLNWDACGKIIHRVISQIVKDAVGS